MLAMHLSHPRLPKTCNDITFASIYSYEYVNLTSDGEELPLFVSPFQGRKIICFGTRPFLTHLAVADYVYIDGTWKVVSLLFLY